MMGDSNKNLVVRKKKTHKKIKQAIERHVSQSRKSSNCLVDHDIVARGYGTAASTADHHAMSVSSPPNQEEVGSESNIIPG